MAIMNKSIEPPFEQGEKVMVQSTFGQQIGGKYTIVESCERFADCESGWMVKIDAYPRPIDSNWLIKKPNNNG